MTSYRRFLDTLHFKPVDGSQSVVSWDIVGICWADLSSQSNILDGTSQQHSWQTSFSKRPAMAHHFCFLSALVPDLELSFTDTRKTNWKLTLFLCRISVFYRDWQKNHSTGINYAAFFVPAKQIQSIWFLHRCLKVDGYSIMCCTCSKLFYV